MGDVPTVNPNARNERLQLMMSNPLWELAFLLFNTLHWALPQFRLMQVIRN
jgi:hypothetical protein